jgi:hypothetical protein
MEVIGTLLGIAWGVSGLWCAFGTGRSYLWRATLWLGPFSWIVFPPPDSPHATRPNLQQSPRSDLNRPPSIPPQLPTGPNSPTEEYRDEECEYLGTDPRLTQPHACRTAAIALYPAKLMLQVSRSGRSPEVQSYASETLQSVHTSYGAWTLPKADHVDIAERDVPSNCVDIYSCDPEGILSGPILLALRFRNPYYAQLFQKRLVHLFRLVHSLPPSIELDQQNPAQPVVDTPQSVPAQEPSTAADNATSTPTVQKSDDSPDVLFSAAVALGIIVCVIVGLHGIFSGLRDSRRNTDPPPSQSRTAPFPETNLSFAADIHPIFMERCGQCHDGATDTGNGFSVDTYASIMLGGQDASMFVWKDQKWDMHFQWYFDHRNGRTQIRDDTPCLVTGSELKAILQWKNEGCLPTAPEPRTDAVPAQESLDAGSPVEVSTGEVAPVPPLPVEVSTRETNPKVAKPGTSSSRTDAVKHVRSYMPPPLRKPPLGRRVQIFPSTNTP